MVLGLIIVDLRMELMAKELYDDGLGDEDIDLDDLGIGDIDIDINSLNKLKKRVIPWTLVSASNTLNALSPDPLDFMFDDSDLLEIDKKSEPKFNDITQLDDLMDEIIGIDNWNHVHIKNAIRIENKHRYKLVLKFDYYNKSMSLLLEDRNENQKFLVPDIKIRYSYSSQSSLAEDFFIIKNIINQFKNDKDFRNKIFASIRKGIKYYRNYTTTIDSIAKTIKTKQLVSIIKIDEF